MGLTRRTLARAAVAGALTLLCLPVAQASALSPLPRSDYGVRSVCGAPAPGHVSCLALELLPRTAAARARTHPLGMRTAQAIRAGSAAQGAYVKAWQARGWGDAARDAGNLEEARTQWTAAADGLLAAEAAGATAFRLPLRVRAAELLSRAGADERAAEVAVSAARDPAADDGSRALAWHLAAHALAEQGSADAKAGKVPAVKVLYADQRGPEPLSPQPPPGVWKSFVDAVDAYLAVSQAEPPAAPEAGAPAEGQGGPLPTPARLALGAARVTFAFDDLAEARRRLDALLDRWPGETDVLAEAVPLYLQTYLVAGDRTGHQAAAAHLAQLIDARAEKANPKEKEGLAHAQDELRKAVSGAAFSSAQKLLDAGKLSDAAQAFEAMAADPSSPDAAKALHNAAIAWDRAGDSTRAAAARERILRERPEAKVAPSDALWLADYRSRKGDHPAAARLYGDFLERWPEHANRCIALQNVASELDAARRGADAAERYLLFGKDAACARADPALAVSALRRAKVLFDVAGKPARASEAAAAAEAARRPAKEK
jgi:TolA-binding protein